MLRRQVVVKEAIKSKFWKVSSIIEMFSIDCFEGWVEEVDLLTIIFVVSFSVTFINKDSVSKLAIVTGYIDFGELICFTKAKQLSTL